jgi:hypothetical protein
MFCLCFVAFDSLDYLFGNLHDLDLLLAIPLSFSFVIGLVWADHDQRGGSPDRLDTPVSTRPIAIKGLNGLDNNYICTF